VVRLGERFNPSRRYHPQMPGSIPRPPAAGVLGCAMLLFLGWTGLVIPSLIRSVETDFGQTDAGLGMFYLLWSITYAIGTFGGGLVTERLGRRAVLGLAATSLTLGLVVLGVTRTWEVFMVAAVPGGLGAGVIDGGSNGLFLDLFRTGRGRALNILHLFFGIGALTAPLAIGSLVDQGVAWQGILIGTGVGGAILAVAILLVPMPGGRHQHEPRDGGARGTTRFGSGIALPLVVLGAAMAAYVASEVGVSSWLVRFLDEAPLSTATTALSLYWGGLALGRFLSSIVADRFDHRRFVTVCSTLMAIAILAAVLVPSLPLSIALFALAGVASGPIFPMVVALGGEQYPDRAAAISGVIAGCGVIGSIVYPPLMGFLSVTVGLMIAMLGNAVLAFAAAGALLLLGRQTRPAKNGRQAPPVGNA
jgi:fucose permease